MNRSEDNKWTGYADGSEYSFDHEQFSEMLLWQLENGICNNWCIITTPVLLFFRKKKPDYLKAKTSIYFGDEEIEMKFTNEDEK